MKNWIFKAALAQAVGSVGVLATLLLPTNVHAAAPLNDESDDPASELASFQIADGFEVKLFASERDGVQKPIQMRFDSRGRMWVIGSTVYPQLQPGQIPNDKVSILEDTDHDGICDKTTVFADGLMIPTGIEVGHGGAYVGHGTELLFLKDTNGDDKADERRVIFRGFGTGDNHQNINSFLWGPGGELWMSQGLHTRSKVETPWGLVRLDKAGLWRFWPKRLKLEGYYGSEYEPQNPWGFSFTYWGEPIVNAGNNSSPIYPVPGLVANRRDEPPPLIWKNGNGRKTSGGDIVGTSHFPEAWQGLLILGGYINNAVWALQIKDDGAGFSLEDAPALIKSTSRKFRPVDVKFGPDGALYICDWYNPIIGHYQASFRHPDRDKVHGRIWRVTAKGRPLTPIPDFSQKSPAQVLENLKSPDQWTRRFAKRVLADLPAESVTNALLAWVAQPQRTDHELLEALGVCQSHEMVTPTLLKRLCQAKDPGARAYAAGVVGLWAERLPDPLSLLAPLVHDEQPRVRLQAVVACARVPQPKALETLLEVGKLPMDKFLVYAVNQAVFALKPVWKPALATLRLDQAGLDLLIRADGSPDTLQYVRASFRSTTSPEQRESLCQTLLNYGNAADLVQVLQLGKTLSAEKLLPQVVNAVRARNLKPPEGAQALLEPFLNSQNSIVHGEALKLAALWKIQTILPRAISAASDENADPLLRKASIEALSEFGGQKDLLLKLASSPVDSVQSTAIAALVPLDPAEAARLAANIMKSSRSDALVTHVLSAFLQRRGATTFLVQSLSKAMVTREAANAGLRLLAASGRTEPALAQILNSAAGNLASEKWTLKDADSLVTEVSQQGNARRGAEVFQRPTLGCTVCHTVNGQGGALGPNLSALGTAQPIDFIIGAILEPQKEIKEGYMSISVTTRDGEEHQGYLLRENKEEIVLREALKNDEVRLRRDRIREQKQNGSIMPSGLADALSRAEFCDLVKYLSGLGKPNP
jgi:putative heme-binding domain-containing protein